MEMRPSGLMPRPVIIKLFRKITLVVSVSSWALGAQAGELSIQSDVDATPAELRSLSDRAQVLEAKIKDLERRVVATQESLMGQLSAAAVEYRLDLRPLSANKKDEGKINSLVVSRIRMSMDGRPFVYSQNALIVSGKSPLPLFLGKLSAGHHQIRLQFQVAPLVDALNSPAAAPWRTIDRVLAIEVSPEAGLQQTKTLAIDENLELRWQDDSLRPNQGKRSGADAPGMPREVP